MRIGLGGTSARLKATLGTRTEVVDRVNEICTNRGANED